MLKTTYLNWLLVFSVLCSGTTFAQQDQLETIQNYLEKNKSMHGLTSDDFADLKIYDQYYTESMELENVYAIQTINTVPVFNAIGSFAIKEGNIIYFANKFKNNIQANANAPTPTVSPEEAILKAAQQLGLDANQTLELLFKKNAHQYVFSKAGISFDEIPVNLVYQPVEGKDLRLAWDLSIHTLDGEHWWNVRIDAQTGNMISKGDWMVSCVFPENHEAHNTSRKIIDNPNETQQFSLFTADGSQYNVYELPIESPSFGTRSIASEPANTTASPYGWHDTDGIAGAEFTITRGNNVHASEDRNGTDTNNGYSPDGGANLNFDFPLDLNQDPSHYQDAAITNLFYLNNKMHDIWYLYGFNEPAGNFQQKNYSTFGQGADYVKALAQWGANSGPLNNANFATPPDGANPYMRMFTWNPPVGNPKVVNVNSPAGLAGLYDGTIAQFGPEIPAGGITADFVLVVDNNSGTSTDPNDACDAITNAAAISGNIAVIRRGICQFDAKVLSAQNAGAIAVIIVNNEPTLITMAGEDPAVNIPSVLIGMTDGEAIITALMGGQTINGTINNFGPFQIDGDLDNGVIAHEYGHGISNRLTGGPSQASCLQNEEQMGEGWSDFFGLVLTMHPDDEAADPRGYATYVLGQPLTGTGLRQFRYSTDMSINPFTYGDVPSQHNVRGSHGVGSIWATILWDLNWALIDEYGFDPDMYNGDGGNNIAMQLVIDGLKLQGCSPGFVDGRNGILAADEAAYGGANQCLIWQVFANRGVGYSATQGSSNSAHDQVESFDMPPASFLDCSTWGTSGFEQNYFQMYPNPTNGILNIASTKIQGEVQINLFDINGRKVMGQQVEMNGKTSLNVSSLSTGIYVVQIISDSKTQTEKLIVQ